MSVAAFDARLAPAAPVREEPRVRTRMLFAGAFGVLAFFEACVFLLGAAAPGRAPAYLAWRATYATAIDVVLWYACMSWADAFDSGTADKVYPYVLGAAVASVVAPCVHWVTGTALFDPDLATPPPEFMSWWQQSIVGACRIAMLTSAYCIRLRATADAARLARTRLERAVVGRKAIESQLRALQGKVEPGLLFETLDDVERACEWDPARADRMLECLIDFLRRALPHNEEEGTTVGRELALARAYLALAEARNPTLSHDIDAPDPVAAAPMAPMLLTPLVAQAVHAAGEAAAHVTVTCTHAEGRTCIVVATEGGELDALWEASGDVAQVARRLEDLYGSDASLTVGATGVGKSRIVLAVPA